MKPWRPCATGVSSAVAAALVLAACASHSLEVREPRRPGVPVCDSTRTSARGTECFGTTRQAVEPSPEVRRRLDAVARDASLFSLIVSDLVASSRGSVIRIDPRPLLADPSILELFPTAGDADVVGPPREPLAHVARRTLRRRTRVLERQRVPPGDALAFGTCPRGLVRLGDEHAVQEPREGCPPAPFTVAIVALPRPSRSESAPASGEQAETVADGSVWRVRVIRRQLQPRGTTGTTLDYVVRRLAPGEWRIVTVVTLMIAE